MLKSPPSLKQRVAVFFFVTVLVATLLGGYMVHYFSEQFRHDIATRNSNLAHHIKEHVNVFLEHHVAELQELKLGINQHGLSEYGYMREEMDHINAFHPLLELVQILDHRGYVLQVSPFGKEYVDIDLSGHSSFRAAMELSGLEVHWSDSFISPHTNDPTVTISLPLSEGVLMAQLNLKELSKAVTSSMSSEREIIVITDRRGVVIAHPDQVMVSQAVSLKNLPSIRSALRGKIGSYSEDWQGEPGLSSVTNIAQSGWVVAVFQPDSQSLGIMYSARRVVIATILSLLAVTVGAFLALQRKVMRPFLIMEKRADMIAAGNYGEDLDAEYEEFSGFVNSFNRMARSVKTREEDLSSSEERFRNLFDEAVDAIFILDDGGIISRVNREATKSLGYAEDELVGSNPSLFVEGRNEKDIKADIASFSEGQTILLDRIHRRKDGSSFHVETKMSRMVGMVGGGIIAYVRDITIRQEAERSLKESEERLRKISEGVQEGVVITEKGVIVEANEQFATLLGYKPGEMIGQRAVKFVHPDSVDLVMQRISSGEEGQYEHDSVKKDGTVIRVQVKGATTTFKGRPARITSIMDITEIRRAEAVLKEQERRYRQLYENNPLGYQSLDEHGMILEVNAAWLDLMGYEREEVVGHMFKDYVKTDSRDVVEKNFPKLLKRGAIQVPEMVLTRKDQREIHVALFGRAAFDEDMGILRTHCLLQDITERKQMEKALQKSSQLAAVGQVASGIAHEINNPLATISAATEALLARIPELRKGKTGAIIDLYEDYLNMTKDEVDRSGKIMRDLLDFARMRDYTLRPVNMSELITDTVKLFSIQSRMDKYNFKLSQGRSTSIIPGDRDRLRQVLVILLSNAVESMPEGGTVELKGSMDRKKEVYRLTVRDEGPGFSPEDMEKTFEPFYTTKGSKGGTGLGLSIAETIVLKHGGMIEARNHNKGGAVMTVTLPMVTAGGDESGGVNSSREVTDE